VHKIKNVLMYPHDIIDDMKDVMTENKKRSRKHRIMKLDGTNKKDEGKEVLSQLNNRDGGSSSNGSSPVSGDDMSSPASRDENHANHTGDKDETEEEHTTEQLQNILLAGSPSTTAVAESVRAMPTSGGAAASPANVASALGARETEMQSLTAKSSMTSSTSSSGVPSLSAAASSSRTHHGDDGDL